MLTAARTRFRRLVASVMLVAVTCFVAHGTAMASHHRGGSDAIPHGAAAAGEHGAHAHGTHAHEPGQAGSHHHHHAVPDAGAPTQAADAYAGGASPDEHAGGGQAPCCGHACFSAIGAATPEVAVAPVTRTERIAARSQTGSGIDPNGLKRPPRPTRIG